MEEVKNQVAIKNGYKDWEDLWYTFKDSKEIHEYIDEAIFLYSQKSDLVYAFVYSSCIYESSAMTMSLHSTRRGAELAMEFHKEKERKEFEDIYEERNDFNCVFGEHEYWGVEEIKIQE